MKVAGRSKAGPIDIKRRLLMGFPHFGEGQEDLFHCPG